MDRDFILEEIRRTAENNDGKALGAEAFKTATGIGNRDWRGRYWARWGDAVREAGLEPNTWVQAMPDEVVFEKLIPVVREFGRFPTTDELDLQRRKDADFPSRHVFRRIGTQKVLAVKLASHCGERPAYNDVLNLIAPILESKQKPSTSHASRHSQIEDGFVYMLKVGRKYKIGKSNAFGRRERELAIQMPDRAKTEHVIKTDDPTGIERYWHQRFAERRVRPDAEWFELAPEDVSAFKRRRFM